MSQNAAAESLKAEGNSFLQKGDFENAVAKYTEAIELSSSTTVYYSNRSAAYLNLAKKYESTGDVDKAHQAGSSAHEDGLKCIELDEQFRKGYSRAGAALFFLKRYEEAKEVYSKGLKLFSDDAALLDGIKSVNGVLGNRPPAGSPFSNLSSQIALNPKLRHYLSNPDVMAKLKKMESGQMDAGLLQDPAIMEILTTVMNLPTSPDTPAPAAKETPSPPPTKKEKSEEVKVEENSDDPATAAKLAGNAHYAKKEFDQAIGKYDEAISLDPDKMTYHLNKAAVYMTMKEFDKAIECSNKGIEVGRDNLAPFAEIAKGYARIAKCHQLQKNYAEAIEFYKKAQLESFDKGIQRTLKNLELEKKKHDAAAYLDDDKAEEAKQKGNDLFRNKEFGEAVKYYEEAVKRAPKDATIRNNLSAALCKIMDFNGAKREIDIALDLDPAYVKAYARRGDIEVVMKEYHKAMESYKKGLQVDPQNASCKEGLRKVTSLINAAASSGSDEDRRQRAEHAMADPEIQAILTDPIIRQILQDFKENPNAANEAMRDATVRAKIEKLVASGILQ